MKDLSQMLKNIIDESNKDFNQKEFFKIGVDTRICKPASLIAAIKHLGCQLYLSDMVDEFVHAGLSLGVRMTREKINSL